MTITLNNRQETFSQQEMSITLIMDEKSFHYKMLIVKLNGILIPRESWPVTVVRDSDRLDIIHLVSGG